MRQYEPIWIQLKSLLSAPEKVRAAGVAVSVNPRFFPRIYKAVVKEKYNDIGFKVQIEPRIALLTHKREASKNKITFFLRLTANSLTGEDV